jgi:hypothetical protein
MRTTLGLHHVGLGFIYRLNFLYVSPTSIRWFLNANFQRSTSSARRFMKYNSYSLEGLGAVNIEMKL